MTPVPTWGDDLRRFDGYSLKGREAVARVFVPLRVDGGVDGSHHHVRWAVALRAGRQGPLHGGISWSQVSELPGDGSWAPLHHHHPAAGILPPRWVQHFVAVVEGGRDQEVDWCAAEDRVRGGNRAGLAAPALAGTDLEHPEDSSAATDSEGLGPRARTRLPASAGAGRASLGEMAREWTRSGFPGRAWRSDGTVGIAAPPYADPLIVSGPRPVVQRLVASPVEAFEVDPWEELPDVVS